MPEYTLGRIPVRPLDYTDRADAINKELIIDYSAGLVYIKLADGTTVSLATTVYNQIVEGGELSGDDITVVIGEGTDPVNLQTYLNSTNTSISTLETNLNSVINPTTGSIKIINDTLSSHDTKINNLYNDSANPPTGVIPTLQTTVAGLNEAINGNGTDIAGIDNRLNNLETTLDSIIDDTGESPTVNVPATNVEETDTKKFVTANQVTRWNNDLLASAYYTATVGTIWSGSTAPYTQVINVEGILATDIPIVDIILSSDTSYATTKTQINEFGNIYRCTTSDGYITLYSMQPTTGVIYLRLVVNRALYDINTPPDITT